MKKMMFLAALVIFSTTACVAQKSNVRRAKDLAQATENPDYNGARNAINEALQDPTTKSLTETWYVAGLIGYQQNKAEILKQQLGKGGTDYKLRGKIVAESYDYWIVADSLSLIPTYNKKGKAKYDTKTRKMIAEKMVEYFRYMELVNYGVETYNAHDYATAYNAFRRYIEIPELPMMQDPKFQEQLVKDEYFETYRYYMALSAYYEKMYNEAIPVFERLLADEKNGVNAGQFLYQSYISLNDSVKANEVLDQCINRFPTEPWFIQNRINNLVQSGKMTEAIDYLDHAIQNDPQVQYFISKGSILNMQKRFEEAIATYEAALSIDPSNAAVYENYGFVFTDMANKLNDEAADLSAKEYKKAKVQIDATFEKALPYFEKAYELAPDNYDYRTSLRSLYYRLGNMEKYEQLSK